MNLGAYQPTESEQALMSQHAYDIRIANDHFVVRHPKFKKLGKIEGGNLADAILRMAAAEEKLVQHPRYAKMLNGDQPTPKTKPQPKAASNGVDHSAEEPEEDLDTPADELHGVALDDSGGKVAKPRKERTPRDASKLAFLQAFKMWLTYPNDRPEDIKDRLVAMGIPAKDSSVVMLRHMLNTAVRAMVDLGFITKESMQQRRDELLLVEKE